MYQFETILLLEKYIVAVKEKHGCNAALVERFMVFYIGMRHGLFVQTNGKASIHR